MAGVIDAERAAREIRRAADSPAGWGTVGARVVAVLARAVPFAGWCLSLNDPTAPMPALCASQNTDLAARQRRFWQIEMQQPDVNKTCHLALRACPVGVLSAATGGDLARSTRWSELLRHGDVGDELRAALVADGRWWGSAAIYRERGSTPFTDQDAATVRRLLPALTATARATWTLEPVASPPSSVEPDPPGTVLLDADGAVVSATSFATAWLSRLRPAERASGSLLYAIAARLTATGGPFGGHDAVRSLTRGERGEWIELDAQRLTRPAGPGIIAVMLQPARPNAVRELLLHAYPLTSRERQVTALAAENLSTEEIARRLFLSRHTVADYLKVIFAKTQVHSRAGPARRLAGLPG